MSTWPCQSTVFLGKKPQPSASVLLQLYSGRSLPESQVASIVHLIASSIPDLEAGRVTVVDQHGRLLSSPDDSSELSLNARQLDYVRRIEQTYVERIETLLAPMLGPGRVRATVAADVDFTQREETQELFAPETVLRSEQVSEDRRNGETLQAAGVPGALSNQPPEETGTPVLAGPPVPGTTPMAGTGATSTINESLRRTRNFEVDRTLSHTRRQQGQIRRLSVAVLVDDKQVIGDDGTATTGKLTTEEMQELAGLVREAVGFDEQRGDSVSISNVAFYQAPPAEMPEGPGLLASPATQNVIKQGLGAALILGIALLLVRPLLRALGGGTSATPAMAAVPGGTLLAADQVAAQPTTSSPWRQLGPQSQRVARIVRAWMNTDD